jgi:hypothetical protein
VEVTTFDRASFWSRGSLKAEFAGKSQSHDEYEYGFRVPGLVEVVVVVVVLCYVRKLQEVGCTLIGICPPCSALLLTIQAIK